MEVIQGGVTTKEGSAFGCGAGLALSIGGGLIGALIFGPSTAALCYTYFNS